MNETKERLESLKVVGEESAQELRRVASLGQQLRAEQAETLAVVERMRSQQHELASLTAATLEAQEQLAAQHARHASAEQEAHAVLWRELEQAKQASVVARQSLEELGKVHMQETNYAREALEALAATASETHRRQEKLSEVLKRIESLQGVLTAEFLDTHRLAFYACAFAVLVLVTATRRLAAGRLPGMLLLCAAFLFERNSAHSLWYPSLLGLHIVQWLIRGACVAFTTALLSAQAWRYQDEAVRLRQLVSEQTKEALLHFFAASTAPRLKATKIALSRESSDTSLELPKIKRSTSRRRVQIATN